MVTSSPLYGPYDGAVVGPHQEAQDWLRAEQAMFTGAGRTLPPPNTDTEYGMDFHGFPKWAHLEQLFKSKLSNCGEAGSAMFPSGQY